MDDRDIPLKRCTACGEEFPVTTEYFHRDKRAKDGLHNKCKACVRIYNKAYLNSPEVQERIYAYRRRPETHELQRKRRKQPLIRERNRTYQYTHRKEHRKKYRYPESPEKRERRRLYRQRPETRELHRIHKHTYRARKRAVTGTHTASQIRELLKQQKHKCYYCSTRFQQVKGKYIYHVDHTFPLSRAVGSDIPANDISYLVLACPACNQSKGDKFPWEFPDGGKLL